MKRIRIGLVGLVVISLTGLTAGGASAAVSGRGTASSSITLLSVDLGNVQHLKVLTDQAQGTMDPARLNLSNPQAFASLSAVDATGLLNLALPNPAWKVTAPGSSNVPVPLASIPVSFPGSAVPLAGTTVPLGVGLLASGTINPVKIEAHSSDTAVDSIVGTSVPNLSVLQGLLSVKGVNVAGVSTNASGSASRGDTGIIGIESVGALSLAGLLGGLGVNNLADLPLGTLTSLVDGLGLPVSSGTLTNLTGGDISGILSTATGLVSSLNSLAGLSAADCQGLTNATSPLGGLPALAPLVGSGTGILGGALAPLNLPVTGIAGSVSSCDVSGVASALTSTLNGLKPTAEGLIGSLLDTLSSAPLLELSGVSLSAVANAADTLANSSATTSANFGTIKVGGKSLGTLDLNATVAQVTALKDQVLGALNTVTGILGLPNLIDIGILERTASVKAEGSYNVATAGLDLLRVSINPPANLSGVVSGLSAAGPLTGVLSGLSLPIPAVAGLPLGTDVLGNAFGLTSLLSQPTTIKVGSINAAADFTPGAGDTLTQTPASGDITPGGTLPRTGGTNGAWFAALAAISLAGAFGITRSLRKNPVPQGDDH